MFDGDSIATETNQNGREYTHRIAVGAYIIRRERMLLLNRNTTPLVWAPPGGRLYVDEQLASGVIREVREECNVFITPICPVVVNQGVHKDALLTAVFFLCNIQDEEIVLSDENSAYCWFTLDEIVSRIEIETDIYGSSEDYTRAFTIYRCLM
jgi:8-oxo-dGTP diphosphatase